LNINHSPVRKNVKVFYNEHIIIIIVIFIILVFSPAVSGHTYASVSAISPPIGLPLPLPLTDIMNREPDESQLPQETANSLATEIQERQGVPTTVVSPLVVSSSNKPNCINLRTDSFTSQSYSLKDGQISPNKLWKAEYTGYGEIKVSNGYLSEKPKVSTSPSETHGSLVTSTCKVKNFVLNVDVKTIKPLRINSKPNNWETAWILWNIVDQCRSYAFFLKYQGNQLEKKVSSLGYPKCDPYQKYLVTLSDPDVKLGVWKHWKIQVTQTETGRPYIQVWVDGTRIINIKDPYSNGYLMIAGGLIGLYNEDAQVAFDNIRLQPLS
jgi:hypothetical protein